MPPKKGRKRRAQDEDNGSEEKTTSVAQHPKIAKLGVDVVKTTSRKSDWKNRQRTLVFSSRGVSYRVRHLMNDLRVLLPHSKKDAKMDRKDKIGEIIPEICDLKNCNNCVYIEMRKKKDVYMWVAKMPHGPSAKFLVQNLHTMDELKLTGNHLKGARPVLSFDSEFDSTPTYRLLKELFFQTFGTPKSHPKSKPFVDHVFSFSIADGRIWFRNYQIVWKDASGKSKKAPSGDDGEETSLVEVGPRFTLCPIRVFAGSFGGPTLFENTSYVSPNEYRREVRQQAAQKYRQRREEKDAHSAHSAALVTPKDPVADVFADAQEAAERK